MVTLASLPVVYPHGYDDVTTDDERLLRISLLGPVAGTAEQLRLALGLDACAIWTRHGGRLLLVDSAGPCERLRRHAFAPGLEPKSYVSGQGTSLMNALVHGDEVVGRIGMTCNRGLPISHDGWRNRVDALCDRLSQEVVWRLTHERLLHEHERMRQSAMMDDVTGAWTRQAFERNLVMSIAAANRRDETLALILFDLIGLERINERHGLAVGDAALAHLAAVLRANVRSTDELGRTAGDEIAVLLSDANLDEATKVASKLAKRLASRPLAIEDLRLQLEVRVAVTTIGPDELTGELALARTGWAVNRDGAAEGTPIPIPWETKADATIPLDHHLALNAGTVLGGSYRVIHELSRGGTGVVYRGEDLVLGRQVAIKVLRSDLAQDPGRVARFRSEAGVLATIHHANLVGVYAAGIDGDSVYFVMELIEGLSLWDILLGADADPGQRELAAVGTVVREVADALDALHGSGLIHRDVKPENILIDRVNGRAVLVDVGTVKRYGDHEAGAGTPGFSAPESFSGDAETFATDVYGLAATTYMMLAGVPPYGIADAHVLLARQLAEEIEPPSTHRPGLPTAIDEVVLRGLARDARERYRSPGAFAAALTAALGPVLPRRAAHGGVASRGVITKIHAAVTTQAGAEEIDNPTGLIRGAALRIAIQAIGIRKGEWWLRRLAEGNADLARLVRPDLPPLSWQPAYQLAELVELAGGDALELGHVIGLGMTAGTFGHVWGGDPSEATPRQAMASIAGYWQRYFTAGEIEVRESSDDGVELVVTGPPAVPALRGVITGTLQRIVELTGGDRVSVQARRITADRWQFSVAWTVAAQEVPVPGRRDDGAAPSADGAGVASPGSARSAPATLG
jgi:diguanylate cyclase (GGDEF)-like protein